MLVCVNLVKLDLSSSESSSLYGSRLDLVKSGICMRFGRQIKQQPLLSDGHHGYIQLWTDIEMSVGSSCPLSSTLHPAFLEPMVLLIMCTSLDNVNLMRQELPTGISTSNLLTVPFPKSDMPTFSDGLMDDACALPIPPLDLHFPSTSHNSSSASLIESWLIQGSSLLGRLGSLPKVTQCLVKPKFGALVCFKSPCSQ